MNDFRACGLYPWDPSIVQYMMKKKKNPPLTSTVQSSQNSNSSHCIEDCALKSLEHFTSPSTLAEFQRCEKQEHWTGPAIDTSLFQVWKNMKMVQNCNENSSQSSQTVPNNSLDLVSPNQTNNTAGIHNFTERNTISDSILDDHHVLNNLLEEFLGERGDLVENENSENTEGHIVRTNILNGNDNEPIVFNISPIRNSFLDFPSS